MALTDEAERRKIDMAHFDRLPKSVRQALAEADHNWSAQVVCTRWNHVEPGYIVCLIKEWDASVVPIAGSP